MANGQNNQSTLEGQLKGLQNELNDLKKQLAESQKKDAEVQAVARKAYEAEAKTEAARQEYYANLAEQANSDRSKREQYYTNNPAAAQGQDIQNLVDTESYKIYGNELTAEGYNIIDDRWQKKATSNDEIDYTNYPSSTTEIDGGMSYPMSEITDLVLVDSISYASGGKWDLFSEPQGTPLPDQKAGLKESEQMVDAVNITTHSLLDKGFSDNSMAGNLFGLSVNDIGTAISTTAESSASVLKYNYSGYGNRDDLKRNIFEDSNDIHNRTQFLGNINKLASVLSNT